MTNVVLQVYDLSQGMARMMSQAFIGRQIDGIWHTSVVVFGLEYFYGGGIAWMPPKTTPYGQPVRETPMGQTTKTKSEFEAFIRKLSPRYSMDGYHILYHNCNHFTEDCLNFLLGKHLPEDIRGLPMEFLNTPMGRSIEPFINRMMQMTSSFSPQQTRSTEDLVSHEMVFSEPALASVTSHESLHALMKREKTVLIFWEAEGVMEVSDTVSALPREFPVVTFACVDSARYPFLAPVDLPQIHVYESDKLTASISGYDFRALRKALGGGTRRDVKLKALSWDKAYSPQVDWNAAKTAFSALVQSGQLDDVDAQHMETIAKWLKRGVVLNIPAFVSALCEVARKVQASDSAFLLLSALSKQPVCNQEVTKAVGASLCSLVSKAPMSAAQWSLALSLGTQPQGEGLVRAQAAALLPVVLSALSSDQESVTSLAARTVVALQRATGAISEDDAQELAVLLFDRLNAVQEKETLESVAGALGMLLANNEDLGALLRELGVEAAEAKLQSANLQSVCEDLQQLWAPESA